MTTEPKVGVLIPSRDEWHADFGMSLLMLAVYCQDHDFPGATSHQVVYLNMRGSILPALRLKMVQDAIEAGCTHILFLDSDMSFPADLIHRMLARDCRVLAANCATKGMPAKPTARAYNMYNPGGDPVYSAGKTGIEPVWRVGTGVMMVQIDVFKHLKMPWFDLIWNPKQGEFVGEDWAFCGKVDKAGIPIYVDHDLSNKIGHHGSFTYNQDCIYSEDFVQNIEGMMYGT